MIRRTKRDGTFWMCLLINALMNLDGTIPAWILLALHIWLDIPVFWFIGALALWIGWLLLWMFVLGWASNCSSQSDLPRENKNPYSVGNRKEDHTG